MTDSRRDAARVELYWLPLGAGDTSGCVRANGRIFEAVVAHRQRRRPAGLYHSALMVRLDGACYAIEMAPAWGHREQDRGVVAEGPVGLPWLGRSRFFRYEIRRWRDGVIPDIAEAVGSPRSMDTDAGREKAIGKCEAASDEAKQCALDAKSMEDLMKCPRK